MKLISKFIQEEQKKVADCTIADKCSDLAGVPKVPLSTKKSLKGHINKVNSVHFSDDSRYSLEKYNSYNDKNVHKNTDKSIIYCRHCVSGSLDGKLIIWDTWSGNKVQVNFIEKYFQNNGF